MPIKYNNVIKKEVNLSEKQIKDTFINLFISAHGIAGLLANNSMAYNEKECIRILENAFNSIESKV